MQFIDFPADAKHHQADYLAAYARVLNSGRYILGEEVSLFEAEFASYLGVKHVVGVGNGLDALHISLLALGIGEGDEVITTALSAVATTLAILAAGATPVFVDVGSDGQIDAHKIAAKITQKTKAIMPVHLYGHACEIEEIIALAKKHNLKVIEDAAQAHGSTYHGQKLGTFGDIGCFSFYPTKNLGTIGGDAGALITNDDTVALIARQLRNYGEESKYKHVRYGLNSRLDEVHAAVLRAKLTWLDASNQKKRHLAALYDQGLANIHDLKIIAPTKDVLGNIHQYVITTPRRDELQKYLAGKGIPTLIHYPTPIHQQPFLAKEYGSSSLPRTEEFCRTTLSLPSHECLTGAEVQKVIAVIQTFFTHKEAI